MAAETQKTRIERDSMGEMEVPTDALWGASTQRAVLISAGLWAIKQRKRTLHMQLMFAAFASSALFLVNYIYYHFSHGDTHFLGQGVVRPIYFTVLITHVLLSVVTFPMILTSFYLGLSNRLVTHRRLSKWTWARWMYVSVTGVVVYFMLHVIRW